MFNSHRISTERNATPNQLGSNGMLDSHNPLACNDIEGPGDVDQFYGEDHEGPSSRDNNNVVVVPDELRDGREICYIHQNIDVNRQYMEAGIDLYIEVLELVLRKIEEFD